MIWDRDGYSYKLRGTKWSMFIDKSQCWLYYKHGTKWAMIQGTFKTLEEACDYIQETA